METSTHQILQLFMMLSLNINREESPLIPAQQIKSTGAALDSTTARAGLPPKQVRSHELVIQLQTTPQITLRTCLSLLRYLASCTFITQHARLLLRCVRGWLKSGHALSRHYMERPCADSPRAGVALFVLPARVENIFGTHTPCG